MRINFILPETGLSGGLKSNRLVAEALVRRGHEVQLAYSTLPRRRRGWRSTLKWAIACLRARLSLAKSDAVHHLSHSTANIIPVFARPIQPHHVPEADVTIGTWWETREWIESWPKRCGIHAYFIRHHEIYLCPSQKERVEATYRMPGLQFVISSWLKQEMLGHYGRSDSVLAFNGVDRTQFVYKPRSRAERPTVGFMYGREEIKGADTVLSAIAILQETYPDLRVISFGADPIDRKYPIPTNSEHFVRPSQNEIPELYRRADCWILPSVLEGFGMPGLEAAACGCPVVATRCGGAEDYVRDGVTGHLVPVGDASEMAKAVASVLSLDPEAWGAMSRASNEATLEFDWDRTAEIVESHLFAALSE